MISPRLFHDFCISAFLQEAIIKRLKTKNDMGWAGMTGGDTGDAAAQLADQLDGGGLNMADTSIELGSAYVE